MFICNTSAQRESGHSATGRLLSNVGAIWQVSTVLNMARCKYDCCLKAIFLHDKSTTDKITAAKITTDKSTTGYGESRPTLAGVHSVVFEKDDNLSKMHFTF